MKFEIVHGDDEQAAEPILQSRVIIMGTGSLHWQVRLHGEPEWCSLACICDNHTLNGCYVKDSICDALGVKRAASGRILEPCGEVM